MKAYQVLKGEMDRHGHQRFELIATYLDKERALDHCEWMAKEISLHSDTLEFDGWDIDNKIASWSVREWEVVILSKFQEIEITE